MAARNGIDVGDDEATVDGKQGQQRVGTPGAHPVALITCCFLASLASAVAASSTTAPQAYGEAIVCAVFFVAGLTQGVLGFGFGIVSMAMLPQFMPLMEVVPIVGIAGCAVTLMLLLQLRDNIDNKVVGILPPLLLGQLGGVPLGAQMLQTVDIAWLRLALGATMSTFSAHQLLESRRSPSVGSKLSSPAWSCQAWLSSTAQKWSSLIVGFSAGVLNGALNQGGPPIVAFFAAQKWERDRTKGALQSYFICTSVYALIIQASSGILQVRHLCLAAAGLPAIILGVAAGVFINKYVDTRVFFNLVMGSLLFLGSLFVFGSVARLLPRSLAVGLPALAMSAFPPLGDQAATLSVTRRP